MFLLTFIAAAGLSVCNNQIEESTETPTEVTTTTETTTEETTEEVTETEPETTEETTEESSEETTATEDPFVPLVIPAPLYGEGTVDVDSKSYVVLDEEGQVWYSKNADMHLKPASTTKVLTALVTCSYMKENGRSLDEVVTISESAVNAVDVLSSGVYPSLRAGETMTVRDLLYALILPSTNAAGNVLAEYIAGSTEAFTDRMNLKCRELGLENSHFVNAHGLDREEHYSCAFDLAVILREACKDPDLRQILGTVDHVIAGNEFIGTRSLKATHQLLNGRVYCQGVFAGKPGWTYGAQATCVTAVERNGKVFYIAVMNSDEHLQYMDTKVLAETAYAAYGSYAAVLPTEVRNARVTGNSASGMTFSWHLTGQPVSCRMVFWNSWYGTGAAQFINGLAPSADMSYTLNFPEQGPYNVQIFATGADGQENVQSFQVLFMGEQAPELDSINLWNGQRYFINYRGQMESGFIELPNDVLFADYDGKLIRSSLVSGDEFYVDDNYEVAAGWRTINGRQYYFQADGVKAIGRIIIDGQQYTFDENGALIP